jgi:hypothetical protein
MSKESWMLLGGIAVVMIVVNVVNVKLINPKLA